MLYFIIIISTLLIAFLLLRLRVRFALDSDERFLFVGLGRSGAKFDYANKAGRILIFGIPVRSFPLDKSSSSKPKKKEPKAPSKKSKGKRDWKRFISLLPDVTKATIGLVVGTLKSLIVEELHGEIKGGFDSPDITGHVYGYYQATIGAVPALAARLNYQPDWTGPSLSGSVRGSVALPVYRLAYQLIVALGHLPLRDIVKMAIGRKKGGQDGRQ